MDYQDRMIQEHRETLHNLKSEIEDRENLHSLLAQWEDKYKELKNEKHKLLQQYENSENEELNEIRELRREAAQLRVKLADQGDANDDLYQTMVTMTREGEGVSKDHVQLKEQLHDQNREVASIEDQISMLTRQI